MYPSWLLREVYFSVILYLEKFHNVYKQLGRKRMGLTKYAPALCVLLVPQEAAFHSVSIKFL